MKKYCETGIPQNLEGVHSPDTGTIHILFNDGTGNFVEEPQVGVEPQYPPISEVNLFIYPNPFNNQTTINFSIKKNGFVELKIYDIKGRLIKRVISQKINEKCYKNLCYFVLFRGEI